jgi:uncharacterized membrane protein YuzA (DUF378 family)
MDLKKVLHIVAFVLLLIGGLNWGLIGLRDFDLLDFVFPAFQPDGLTENNANIIIQQVIQSLVGISAVYVLFTHKSDCKVCNGK